MLEFLGFTPPKYIKAVDNVSFKVNRGEVFGVVGESGCGKTTLGRLVAGLIRPTKGNIFFENRDLFSLKKEEMKKTRCEIQMIFQNPYESLSPVINVYDLVAEPLEVNKLTSGKTMKDEMVAESLRNVRLPTSRSFTTKRATELSGGERQRVCIARTLVMKPKLVVADEPVSMLDASIRAEVLNLLIDLKDKFGITFLFITHDFHAASYACDRILTMYLGKIIETGYTEQIINEPLHPYSRALISAVPTLSLNSKCYVRIKGRIVGQVPDPTNPPEGCRFHPRCPYAMGICKKEEPEIIEVEKHHLVACHLYSLITAN